MKICLLLLLWIAFWAGLSLRQVPTPVATTVTASRSAVWPSARLWQLMLERRPDSFFTNPERDKLGRLHQDWTPERISKHPYLLPHLEQCHEEEVSSLAQLASGRKRLTGSDRYFSHPLADVQLTPAEIAAYEELLPGLPAEPQEGLNRVLNRLKPDRIKALLEQFERPDNPDWWLDAEALSRLGSRRGLEKILSSPNPGVRSLAPVLEWLRTPEDAKLWKAALKVALEQGPGQPWARARLIQFGPEPLRIRACTELVRKAPFWIPTGARGLAEWGWRWVEKGSPSLEARQILRGMLGQPLSPKRQQQARRLVLDERWPADLRKMVALKLLRDHPANLNARWLELWPDLYSDLDLHQGKGPAYQRALDELDRRHEYTGNIPERLWLAGRLTSARARKVLSGSLTLSQGDMGLSSALGQKVPSGLLVELLGEDGDGEWAEHVWTDAVKQDQRIDQALLARLGRGQFQDYFTIELLMRPGIRYERALLEAIRKQGGGPGGLASALLGKLELGGGDANFLACHLMAHLYLKHDNLPVERVSELQEGAPSRLFQAAQAYLEASEDPLAAPLLRKRGGRLLIIDRQASCRWLSWLPTLRQEVLQRQTPILAWSDFDEVRSEVRGNQLRVIRGAETRIRMLSASEMDFLRQLHNPGAFKPHTGYGAHSQTLVSLTPQGGWALNPSTLPPGHPGRNWSQRLWEISQKPEGTVEWSFAADFPKVETLAYYPGEIFEGIGLLQGRPVLKTFQGWCDLRLKPCPAPQAVPNSRWQAVDETAGVILPDREKTRLGRLDWQGKLVWSYLFHGLKFEHFCLEGRELYFEAGGRVVHLTLPDTAL